MDGIDLKAWWIAEETAAFEGWDFSHLEGRWQSGEPRWDYAALVRRYLKDGHILLDMGTGGGEFLLSLRHPYGQTYVTEGYPPNVDLCMKTLAPLGIGVKQVLHDSALPFEDAMFDIVINCHESFDLGEVARVLKPGGVFITQQVGGENDRELRAALAPEEMGRFSGHTLEKSVAAAKDKQFEILFQDEDFPQSRFFDVGAIVYFAKVIEWEFPGFSVTRHFDRLCMLREQLERQGHIENTEHRFVIVACKNG